MLQKTTTTRPTRGITMVYDYSKFHAKCDWKFLVIFLSAFLGAPIAVILSSIFGV